MSAVNSTPEGTASSFEDTQQSSRKECFLKRCPEFAKDCDLLNQVLTIALICNQSNFIEHHYIDDPLDAYICSTLRRNGSKFDLEFKRFLERNCQFLLELCMKPAESPSYSVLITPRTNLELQLVLVDRALETKSKVRVSRTAEGKMEDKFQDEILGKLSELAGSIKSMIEAAANGSNSLEQPSKKRKSAPK
ncbi:hypothetical protein EAF00_007083 [Botryotinia globosa]|nr:hypothetical protein EAF00_007083 [Botryotinia globosa]